MQVGRLLLPVQKPLTMESNNSIWIRKSGLLVFLLFLGLIMGSCQGNKNKAKNQTQIKNEMKKFEWRPTESAPKKYPIEIYQGIIGCEDGSFIKIPSGGRTVHNGWGETGSTYVVGEDFKSVPQNLKLSWLSFTENTFYTGDFELPADDIKAYFEKGYTDHLGEHETYSNLIIGMAPGGSVSVWLFGADKSVEVGHYKAAKTEISMKDFNPSGIQDRNEYVASTIAYLSEDIKQHLKEEGFQKEKWDVYRQKFSWKFNFKFKDSGTPSEIRTKFFDGSHFYLQTENPEIRDYNLMSLPKEIGYKWYDKDKNKYGADIAFNEEEIFKSFNSIFKNPENRTIDLIIEVDADTEHIRISLKSKNETIGIENTQVKIYVTST